MTSNYIKYAEFEYPRPRLWNYKPEHLIIGERVSLMSTFLDCTDKIVIEDEVMFGHDVKLLTGSHRYEGLTGWDRQINVIGKPITIRRGVWIATGVIILQGVTIGEHSIVGAGSVVTHDVPPYQF